MATCCEKVLRHPSVLIVEQNKHTDRRDWYRLNGEDDSLCHGFAVSRLGRKPHARHSTYSQGRPGTPKRLHVRQTLAVLVSHFPQRWRRRLPMVVLLLPHDGAPQVRAGEDRGGPRVCYQLYYPAPARAAALFRIFPCPVLVRRTPASRYSAPRCPAVIVLDGFRVTRTR